MNTLFDESNESKTKAPNENETKVTNEKEEEAEEDQNVSRNRVKLMKEENYTEKKENQFNVQHLREKTFKKNKHVLNLNH